MEKIKLICVDLDGTLLRDDHQSISTANLEAIRLAVESGIAVAPATGRLLARLPEAVLALPGLRYAITANGAEVLDLEKDEPLYGAYLSVETTLSMLKVLRENGLPTQLYQSGEMFVERAELERLLQRPLGEAHLAFLKDLQPLEDFDEHIRLHPQRIAKINVPYVVPASFREKLARQFSETGLVEVTSSVDHNLELNAPGVNKAGGVAALCRHLNISSKNVMAIGDGDNDREMLAFVGRSVAMENAPPQIRAIAKILTGTNENDGVASAILSALK